MVAICKILRIVESPAEVTNINNRRRNIRWMEEIFFSFLFFFRKQKHKRIVPVQQQPTMYRVHLKFIWMMILFIFHYSQYYLGQYRCCFCFNLLFTLFEKKKILGSSMRMHVVICNPTYVYMRPFIAPESNYPLYSSTHKSSAIGVPVHHFGNLWYIAADEHYERNSGEKKTICFVSINHVCLQEPELCVRWSERWVGGKAAPKHTQFCCCNFYIALIAVTSNGSGVSRGSGMNANHWRYPMAYLRISIHFSFCRGRDRKVSSLLSLVRVSGLFFLIFFSPVS